MEHLHDIVFPVLGNLHFDLIFLAADYTNVKDPDVIGQMQGAWNNFVKTGQIWATLIGIIIGYVFKSLTSYG
ncbi:hypothetical protein A0J48_010575 [Sphaerospermopsis aphanizomenoides BCCUSP55]|uniref:hypothetical protein n=1 Tax=Sphaerospermopsis aphanizomenoides TaxID=459663 RepID=UPI001907FB0E|nr:hypothetical protein [Sphaerospermopsis aphanizomenoides]MBK1987978.1 hypothetical protein [Sphaerospermopsis aphanizomenoides BCCUSP55]